MGFYVDLHLLQYIAKCKECKIIFIKSPVSGTCFPFRREELKKKGKKAI